MNFGRGLGGSRGAGTRGRGVARFAVGPAGGGKGREGKKTQVSHNLVSTVFRINRSNKNIPHNYSYFFYITLKKRGVGDEGIGYPVTSSRKASNEIEITRAPYA